MTIVHKCNCRHSAQDSLHGEQMRAFNSFDPANQAKKYRCTVCKSEISKGEESKKK